MASSIDQFDIVLDHDIDEQYQYEPGELLSGTVILKLNEPIKISAVQVQIRGESTVSWEDDATRSPQTYTAEEVYVNVTQNIATADVTGELLHLDRGSHRYPMEYMLPDNLPSSFIGKHGSITYVAKATLKEDRRLGLSSMITSEPFLVLRKLDIMQEHKLLMAREETMTKRFSGGFAFCSSGKVTCHVKVNKTGHLPGEDIFMDAELSNQSPRVVEAIEATVVMHSTFYARNKSRYNRQVVNKKRDEWELTQGEGRRWKGVRLTIPPYIPESRLDGCDIIDIRYELNFRIDISGKNNYLSCSIPITVGSATNSNSSKPKRGYTLQKMSANWRSKDDLYNAATLPIRGGGGGDENDAPNTSANHDVMTDPDIRRSEDVDPEMFSDATLRFRRPIEMGETRHNPLMDFVAENGPGAAADIQKQAFPSASPPRSPDFNADQYNHLSDYDAHARHNGSAQKYDEFHIEPDTTEGHSDDDDDDDMPPPPTPSQVQAPHTPTNVPPTPTGLPPPPTSAPPPPPLRPGP